MIDASILDITVSSEAPFLTTAYDVQMHKQVDGAKKSAAGLPELPGTMIGETGEEELGMARLLESSGVVAH